jgi:hypothetical protein
MVARAYPIGRRRDFGATAVAKIFVAIFIVAALPCVLFAASPAGPRGPATQPAAIRRGPAAPAPDPLATMLHAAIESGNLASVEADVTPQLLTALDNLKKPDLNLITRLAAARNLGRFVSSIPILSPEDRQTLNWLVDRPRLFPLLALAVDSSDVPEDLLTVLRALRADAGDALDDMPDLTVALCVTADKPPMDSPANAATPAPAGMAGNSAGPVAAPFNGAVLPVATAAPLDTNRAVGLLHYYRRGGAWMRFSLGDLPWQLAIYVVDIQVSEAEISWAINRYGHMGVGIGQVYFDVPYDTNVFYNGSARQVLSHPYTLDNLQRFGGICVDQAWFAAETGKSLAVPACAVSGQSGAGEGGHAWIGFLDRVGQRVTWNFTQGRYPEMLFWSGTVVDPQNRRRISESEVAVLAELQGTTPAQRLASSAIYSASDAAGGVEQITLLEKAIDLSPGNRPAWNALAEIGFHRQLTPDQRTTVESAIQRLALGRYPDFAYKILRHMSAGGGNDEQLAALQNMTRLFANRPDLLAAIHIAQGNILAQSHPDDALAQYGIVLHDGLNTAPLVLEAMSHVDQLLREQGRTGDLAGAYQWVLDHLPRPQPSAYAPTTPYYLLGSEYESLLTEMGNVTAAAQVQARLDMLRPVIPLPQ